MIKIIKLQSSQLEVEIIPELGGRVQKLLNKKNNFDWVWKNENLQISAVDKDTNYDDNWQGGWEELFPNDAVENFSWGKGYDHGETWSHNWDIIDQSKDSVELKAVNLESGSSISKKYILIKNKLRVEYQLDVSFDDIFLFKLHLAIPIHSKCIIHGEFENINKVNNNFGNILQTKNEEYFLTPVKNSNHFDFAYIKNNINSLKVEQENNIIELIYDKEFLNYLWIFQSQGGWKNHNVIVLEPASNGKKLFHDAIESNEYKKGPLKTNTHYEVIVS
jgi:galactose mutarotase-like enzyme